MRWGGRGPGTHRNARPGDGAQPAERSHDRVGRWATLPVAQRHALLSAAKRLAREFDGAVDPETVEQFLHAAYDEFAGRAVTLTYVPLRAEQFAGQRLRARATVAGLSPDRRPVVLFVCPHNAGCSPMAVGWFNQLARRHCSRPRVRHPVNSRGRDMLLPNSQRSGRGAPSRRPAQSMRARMHEPG